MRSLVAAILVLAAVGCSSASEPAPPKDVTAPTVATALGRYDLVRGAQSLDVDAKDDVAIARTELLADGVKVAEATKAPFSLSWDSATVADGVRTLKVVAYDAAGNAGESTEVPVLVTNTATLPVYDEFPKAQDGQFTSTYKVPANWDGNTETTDLKYHWNMPAGVTHLVAVLNWDPSLGFNLNFSSGTGWCPDSGVLKVKVLADVGEALIEYAPGAELQQSQWFVHVGAENAKDKKGQSLPFTARVALLK